MQASRSGSKRVACAVVISTDSFASQNGYSMPEAVKEQKPPLQTARVLVSEVNWLGDLVMSLPALKAVRRAFPTSHLAVLVREELASFFDGFSFIDEVLTRKRFVDEAEAVE